MAMIGTITETRNNAIKPVRVAVDGLDYGWLMVDIGVWSTVNANSLVGCEAGITEFDTDTDKYRVTSIWGVPLPSNHRPLARRGDAVSINAEVYLTPLDVAAAMNPVLPVPSKLSAVVVGKITEPTRHTVSFEQKASTVTTPSRPDFSLLEQADESLNTFVAVINRDYSNFDIELETKALGNLYQACDEAFDYLSGQLTAEAAPLLSLQSSFSGVFSELEGVASRLSDAINSQSGSKNSAVRTMTNVAVGIQGVIAAYKAVSSINNNVLALPVSIPPASAIAAAVALKTLDGVRSKIDNAYMDALEALSENFRG